jgi:hypothetical protein
MDKLTEDMKAFAKQANVERKAQREAALAAMTQEKAAIILKTASDILRNEDYLAGAYQVGLVVDWLAAQSI